MKKDARERFAEGMQELLKRNYKKALSEAIKEDIARKHKEKR